MDFPSHLESHASPSMGHCSEKFILAKQFNDSIYIYRHATALFVRFSLFT